MNLKSFGTVVKNVIIFVFTMIVLAGATGLSYKAHYCHNHFAGIAFFTELGLQKPASCGCKEDALVSKAKKENAFPISINKKGCCSEISFFGRLKIETTVLDYSSNEIILPVLEAALSNIPQQLMLCEENEQITYYKYPPPPLAGRKLVLFLSQQRIPSVSYDC